MLQFKKWKTVRLENSTVTLASSVSNVAAGFRSESDFRNEDQNKTEGASPFDASNLVCSSCVITEREVHHGD